MHPFYAKMMVLWFGALYGIYQLLWLFLPVSVMYFGDSTVDDKIKVYIDLFFKCDGKPAEGVTVHLKQQSIFWYDEEKAVSTTNAKGFLNFISSGWSVIYPPSFYITFTNTCCHDANVLVDFQVRPKLMVNRNVVYLEEFCDSRAPLVQIHY